MRVAKIISMFVSDDWQAWKNAGDRCERRRGMIEHFGRGRKKIRPSNDVIAPIRDRTGDDIATIKPGDDRDVFVAE